MTRMKIHESPLANVHRANHSKRVAVFTQSIIRSFSNYPGPIFDQEFCPVPCLAVQCSAGCMDPME